MEGQIMDYCELLKQIARETARMAYPGGMSRGRKHCQIVPKGTKKELEEYFAESFPIKKLRDSPPRNYGRWHKNRVDEISQAINGNLRDAVAAKLLDTFMHQLMKWAQFRCLYRRLHLPLDRKVLGRFYRELKHEDCLVGEGFTNLVRDYKDSPYTLSYKDYMRIQNELWHVVTAWNRRLPQRLKLESRVELNCMLWAH